MTRLSSLDQLLFDVDTRPIYAHSATEDGSRPVRAADHVAVVDTRRNRVVSVVSTGYRLVLHRHALEWGKDCCVAAFPGTRRDEWQVIAADGPSTGSCCFIDLGHVALTLDFLCRPGEDLEDAFGPFLRITNSYNRQRALKFDIGIQRKVCTNGLIIAEPLISFSFPHSKRDLADTLHFNIDHAALAKRQIDFESRLAALVACPVSAEQGEKIVLAVLGLRHPKPDTGDRRVLADWDTVTTHVRALVSRYRSEVGDNAYAVFNALTDYATRPIGKGWWLRERNSLQRRAGTWFNEFSEACGTPGFQLNAYLKSLNGERNQARRPVGIP